jgi:hypothetical protein
VCIITVTVYCVVVWLVVVYTVSCTGKYIACGSIDGMSCNESVE